MGWRYLAQQAITGQLLDLDLPLKRDNLSWVLSGAGQLSGTITPEYASLRWANGQPVLSEWGTLLFAEQNGSIRWGGILTGCSFSGAVWSLNASSYLRYPADLPYTGPVRTYKGVSPYVPYSMLWDHMQGCTDGDLGIVLQLNGAPPARVGSAAEPYSLTPWEAPDIGGELTRLADESPFDVVETHAWSTVAPQTLTHRLTLSYPRAGRRRDDLVFDPTNVTTYAEAVRDGDEFAQSAYVLGAGEGQATIRGLEFTRDNRLRRVVCVTDKTAQTVARARALAAAEVGRRRLATEVSSITVSDHPNAQIGSWALGDDVLVEGELETVGRFAEWHRIVGWSMTGSDSQAQLQLRRSDRFRYAA